MTYFYMGVYSTELGLTDRHVQDHYFFRVFKWIFEENWLRAPLLTTPPPLFY